MVEHVWPWEPVERLGTIVSAQGLKLVAHGPPQSFIGEWCELLDPAGVHTGYAEVTGFSGNEVWLMPHDPATIRMGQRLRACNRPFSVPVSTQMPGRVLDAMAKPIDGGHPLRADNCMPLYGTPCNPLQRAPITRPLQTGIAAIDTLLPLGYGQRIGLFAGSGVGKSTLLANIAANSDCTVNVIALIGERGREVEEFVNRHIPASVRAKTVFVVATSDAPALLRRQAAFCATTIAEYFCAQGESVMLFVDSITRLAMAEREIGLSLGEPPTARGYTPRVFAMLPTLLERAGHFAGKGSITGIYSVLVEGDDFEEPVADALRAILDGHIILTRERAHRGRFPAIDILQSTSRLANQLLSTAHQQTALRIRKLLGLYAEHRDFVTLGAWTPGKNPGLDHAIACMESLENLLFPEVPETAPPLDTVFQQLGALLP